jgi:hypothetical protein
LVEPQAEHVPVTAYEKALGIAASVECSGNLGAKVPVRPGHPDPSPAVPQKISDSEWDAIEVGGVDLRQYLLTSAAAVTPDQLLRHRELNPRDVYIPAQARRDLWDLMRPLQKDLYKIVCEQSKVRDAEFSEMIESGAAAFVEAPGDDLDLSRLPATATDKYNTFRRVGGRIYMVDTDRLPGTEVIALALQAKSAEVAVVIAQWFYSQGAMTTDELVALVRRIAASGKVSWNADRNN